MAAAVGTCSSTFKTVQIHDLVKILINDSRLLTKWAQLSDSLKCQLENEGRWSVHCLTYNYDRCSEILTSWISRNPERTVSDLCQVLREIICVGIAETLEATFEKETIITHESDDEEEATKSAITAGMQIKCPIINHGLLVPVTNFSGREEQLQQLHSYFNSNKTNSIVICGIDGIGKTELCRKFAHEISLSDKSKTVSRVWLHGNRYETLYNSILNLAAELGVTHYTEPSPSEYFEYIVAFILESCDRLLVVIDDVGVEYEELLKIIQLIKSGKYRGKIFIVVTSNIALESAGISLDVFSKDKVRDMLHWSISGFTDSDADKLGELVQYLPLALQQAIAYIKQQKIQTQNYTVSNYFEEFEQKTFKLLEQTLNKIEHTTLVTCDITFGKLTRSAVEILKMLAYLEPDEVDLNFLEKICECRDYMNFEQGLNMLSAYSLVRIGSKNVTIHRFVQEFMRGKMEDSKRSEIYLNHLFERVLLSCEKFEKYGKRGPSNSEKCHLKSVCRFAFNQEIHIASFQDALQFLLEHDRINCAVEYTETHVDINFIYFERGLGLTGTRMLLEKLLLCEILTPRLTLRNETIEKCWYNPDFASVNLASLKLALKLSQKCFGDSKGITFEVKNELVRKFCDEGEIDKALELCQELVNFNFNEEQKKLFCLTVFYVFDSKPSKIERLLEIVDGLIQIVSNSERKELEAQIMHLKGNTEKSLQYYTELFNKTNDKAKISYYNFKIIELKIKLGDNIGGKDSFAREFHNIDYSYLPLSTLERILHFYEENLGESHLLTVKVKNTLADKLVNSEKVRWVSEKKFDRKNGKPLINSWNARNIENNVEKKKRLEKLLQEGKGVNNSSSFRIMELLAKTMEELGELREALELYEKVMKSAVNCGWSDQELKESRVNVARLKLRLREFTKLETREDVYREFGEFEGYSELRNKTLESILTFYNGILGENDKLTLIVKNAMAFKLYEDGKYKESVVLLEQIVKSNDKEEIRVAYGTMEKVARWVCHRDQRESLKLLYKVRGFKIQYLGEKHKETVETEEIIRWVKRNFGRSKGCCVI